MKVWKRKSGKGGRIGKACDDPAATVSQNRLNLNTAAAALLRVAAGDEVVIITDEGLATVAPFHGRGLPGFRVTTAGESGVAIACAAVPLPQGRHELRMTRIGWAWGHDEEPDPTEDAFDAILELPPWRPPVEQSEWIESLDRGDDAP